MALRTPDDVPHVAYTDEMNIRTDLLYAEKPASAWQISSVDSSEMYGDIYGVYLALDNNGRPHIVYVKKATNGLLELRHAFFAGVS